MLSTSKSEAKKTPPFYRWRKDRRAFFIDSLSDNTIYTFYVQALIYHVDVEFEKVPSLDAQFPIPSYDEQLESIRSFLEGKKDEEGDQKDEKSEAKQEAAKEAASDLDD